MFTMNNDSNYMFTYRGHKLHYRGIHGGHVLIDLCDKDYRRIGTIDLLDSVGVKAQRRYHSGCYGKFTISMLPMRFKTNEYSSDEYKSLKLAVETRNLLDKIGNWLAKR